MSILSVWFVSSLLASDGCLPVSVFVLRWGKTKTSHHEGFNADINLKELFSICFPGKYQTKSSCEKNKLSFARVLEATWSKPLKHFVLPFPQSQAS